MGSGPWVELRKVRRCDRLEYMMKTVRNGAYTIWVCICCLVAAVNDDDTGCGGFWGHVDGDESHPEGLRGLMNGSESSGMFDNDHECGIPYDAPDGRDCLCETDTWSTSPCDGCGSRLHGERHAMTAWEC